MLFLLQTSGLIMTEEYDPVMTEPQPFSPFLPLPLHDRHPLLSATEQLWSDRTGVLNALAPGPPLAMHHSLFALTPGAFSGPEPDSYS